MVEENNEDIWFLDSGCSNHVTGNISMFSMLEENVKSQVTLGTDSKVSVMGKGRVSVLTEKGERRSISDVYYVYDMKCNILNIGQLIHKDYNVFFEDDVCTIMDNPPSKKCIAQVKMTRNKIFPLKMRANLKKGVAMAAVTQETFQREAQDENWLLNLRFGHLNFGGLNLLHRKEMIKRLPLI